MVTSNQGENNFHPSMKLIRKIKIARKNVHAGMKKTKDTWITK